MASPTPSPTIGPPFPATSYTPKYTTWPYHASDFTREDENPDSIFYRQARLVTHIDNAAITRLATYYDGVLPRRGKVMDMCTSWKSYYPDSMYEAVQNGALAVFGVGLNAEEMAVNSVIVGTHRWRVADLNREPYDIRARWQRQVGILFDAVTCVVSIDYLNRPLEVCGKVLDAVVEGGTVHFVVSNRCFPNKVVRRWLVLDERERLEMVADYLFFSGWKEVEIVDLCARDENGERITDDQGTVLVASPSLPRHLDPLWVVRATKKTV
ncbi:hypothetical protein BDW02DRAFT_505298 [Decorospora gaudefroyi]|uniref:S-adenosyl-L-methionine-dependent methyltransferase n=1 Tax=Decorospora gaudefroyi TaxID=184978 RepID=A0A6A5K3P7_9PLEO|nr:hypothetical protein BDW02DRAFT_505298 [Decorospora gaudefroyi]